MKRLRVGINGCGRIGRAFIRQYLQLPQPNFDIVVINDLMSLEQCLYLLRFDSIHGRLENTLLEPSNSGLDTALNTVHGSIAFLQSTAIPDWRPYNLDVVVEVSGVHSRQSAVQMHFAQGVPHVLLGAPLLDDAGELCLHFPAGFTGLLPGAALHLNAEHQIFSAFSCTTQALVTLMQPLLSSQIVIESMMVTELHGFTSNQKLVDGPHTDWRRGRSATESIIPTATKGIFGVEYFFPQLREKVAGYSIRVPVPNMAALNVCLHLAKPVELQVMLAMYKQAAASDELQRLAVDNQPGVSKDYLGRTESAVLATDLCQVNHHQLRLYAWYDNEYGYARRLIDSLNTAIYAGQSS